MAPFNLNSRYVEANALKIVALRKYLTQKSIGDEDLQRDEICHEILKGPFARVAQIGPSACNSLRGYIKSQGGVRKFLQLPIWLISPAMAVATFNKRIQNAVPRESDFQQISPAQNRSIVQELFDAKDVDEEIIKRYRALSKLITNTECEQHIPKRLTNQNKTEVIQYLREYMREGPKQDDEVRRAESESEEEHNECRRRGQQQEREGQRYSANDFKSDMTELNEVMGKLLSGGHVEFLAYAMAVHSTFLKMHANLQSWERQIRQQADRCSSDPDESLRYGKHEKKSHRRSLPSKH